MSNNDKLEILLFNVSNVTGYTIEQIKSHWLKRKVVEARHAYFIVAKTIVDNELSLSEIGRKIDRKHTTVIWGIKKVKKIKTKTQNHTIVLAKYVNANCAENHLQPIM